MTIAFKSQFSFIEGGHVFASNLKNKAKQNKKETEKRNYKTIQLTQEENKTTTTTTTTTKTGIFQIHCCAVGLDASTTTVIREVVS